MDDSRGSRVEEIRGGVNACTRVFSGEPDPRLASSAIGAAWSSLVPGLSLIAPADPSQIAYRFFWTGCGENGFRDFACARDAHMIIGRHACADIVLAHDAELSLRHLLVVPAKSARGGAAVRLVDLRASVPMFLEDEAPQRSLHAEGPFAVRLGRYVLGGFPIGPGQGHPPADLPPPDRVDATGSDPASDEPAAPRGPGAEGGGPYRVAADRGHSIITMLPRPITMVESIGSADRDAIGLLGAAREGERVRVPIRAADLRAGVLVGRADKCGDLGLRPLLTILVSRVHAVVIEVEGRTMLYDCASTNGTFVGRRSVRSVELGDAPVQLAGSEGLELRWTSLRPGGER